MIDASDTRRRVEKFYRDAVEISAEGCGCCRSSTKGDVAPVAGYAPEDLDRLPRGAVENSFGCGNPLAFAGIAAGDTVLDLGSGAGIDLLLAAERVGPSGRVIGVDMTEAMIERARENAAAAGLRNVELRRGIIEVLPVKDASIDWVISNCVINLSPEKPRVFAEIARVLRPGGRLRVSDIVAEGLPGWLRRSEDLHDSCVAGALSEDEYLEGLRAAGLVDAEVIERLHYEPSQMEAFIGSELPAGATQDAKTLARDLAGKVWSAKIQARKP